MELISLLGFLIDDVKLKIIIRVNEIQQSFANFNIVINCTS